MRFVILLIAFMFILKVNGINSDYIVINDDIELKKIGENAYVHISWDSISTYGKFSSNGLFYIKNNKALMIDTPTNNEKTRQLVEYVENHFDVQIDLLIVSHYHNDCMGGIDYIHSRGIPSLANKMTVDKCKELKLPPPKTSFLDNHVIHFQGEEIICKYFGEGHTVDNICTYLPQSDILFGGCLIKAQESNGLGNIAEANVDHWDQTVLEIKSAYPNVHSVIPGHGPIGDASLFDHTISLVQTYRENH